MPARMQHPLVDAYLDRLERAADHLPRARRRELVDEIESHLVEALGPDPVDAEVLVELERLGDPSAIAEAEAPRPVVQPAPSRRPYREPAAIAFLLLGGFLFWVGWLVGLFLLWTSRVWTLRDKLIGTSLLCGRAGSSRAWRWPYPI